MTTGWEGLVAYNNENVFAKILRGEMSCDKVYEDEHVLAFNDINPQRPVHILVIPKGSYENMSDFSAQASDQEITALIRAAGKIADDLGLSESGFRLICNNGSDGHQEVPHLHVHIIGGASAGPMLKRQAS